MVKKKKKVGDIIFFDWDSDESADHVGIVEKVENGTVYRIEENTGEDMCKQNVYSLDNQVIHRLWNTCI